MSSGTPSSWPRTNRITCRAFGCILIIGGGRLNGSIPTARGACDEAARGFGGRPSTMLGPTSRAPDGGDVSEVD
jgi:hypothetical protein